MNEFLVIKEESPHQAIILEFLHQGDAMHRDYRAYVGRTADELSKPPFRFAVAYWRLQIIGCGALNTDTGEIERVFVDESARRQGIASRIVAYLEDVAQKKLLSCVFLDVAERNAVALEMYKNKGYRPIKTLHEFVTMKKSFQFYKTPTKS